MNSIHGILRTIILLGAIQGIITGFLLFYSSTNRRSNRILAVLLWLMSLAGLNLYFEYNGWFYISTTVAIIHALVPMVIIMPMGPLIYFYIRSSLDPDFRIKKKQRIHFLSIVIDLVPQLTAAIFIIGSYFRWLNGSSEPWGIFVDTYNIYADIPRWLSLTVYIGLSGKYILDWKNKHTSTLDPVLSARMRWLQLFTRVFMVFQAIWLLYLIPYVLPRYNQWILSTFDWYPVYIPIAVLIYWLGIKGYIVGITVLTNKKKKNEAAIPEQVVAQMIKKIEMAIEGDKLYLNPSLSINELSKHTGIASKTLSLVLNQYIGMSFNDYVNQFRVAEFKRKLLQGDWAHLTITGIAFECGFNSKASFQRIFKQQTGMSPSEFRKSDPLSP